MTSAVSELEKKLLSLDKISYDIIDNVMRKIMKSHDLTAKELHNAFVSKNKSTPDNWIKKMKKINEDHKEIASGKKKDDEGYMARSELDSIERAVANLRKAIKSGDQQLPAWVQSKITKAADYIDTAAEYLQSDEKLDEASAVGFTIDPQKLRADAKAAKIRSLAKRGSTEGEREAAQSKTKGPKLFGENISLVEKILGEEKCGKGMYWCNTDKKCKPMPKGMEVPGQKIKPTEVGIGKPVEGSCTHTKKGHSCPVHGKGECPMSEETDPKGPTKSYKTVEEIAKKHNVSVETIKSQLEMGIKVEGEHTTSKSEAKITALQHLDEVPNYYTKLKKVESKKIEEAVRIQSQTGNLILVTLSWRGKYYTIQMFFPQVKMPNRQEVTLEVQKIYPDARVMSYHSSIMNPGQPIIQISNSPSKNYLLNNKNIGEETEVSEGAAWTKK